MVGYETRIYEPPSEKGHLIRELPKVTPCRPWSERKKKHKTTKYHNKSEKKEN